MDCLPDGIEARNVKKESAAHIKFAQAKKPPRLSGTAKRYAVTAVC